MSEWKEFLRVLDRLQETVDEVQTTLRQTRQQVEDRMAAIGQPEPEQFNHFLQNLNACSTQEEILETFLKQSQFQVTRGILFLLQEDQYSPWKSYGFPPEQAPVIPLEQVDHPLIRAARQRELHGGTLGDDSLFPPQTDWDDTASFIFLPLAFGDSVPAIFYGDSAQPIDLPAVELLGHVTVLSLKNQYLNQLAGQPPVSPAPPESPVEPMPAAAEPGAEDLAEAGQEVASAPESPSLAPAVAETADQAVPSEGEEPLRFAAPPPESEAAALPEAEVPAEEALPSPADSMPPLAPEVMAELPDQPISAEGEEPAQFMSSPSGSVADRPAPAPSGFETSGDAPPETASPEERIQPPPTPVGQPDEVPPEAAPQAAAAAPEADPQAQQHAEARRLSRLLISEIKLNFTEEIRLGQENGDLYPRLKEQIDERRNRYEVEVSPEVAAERDYFHEEVLGILAAGDAAALGDDYPGEMLRGNAAGE